MENKIVHNVAEVLKAALLVMIVGVSVSLPAMPTQQELAKAEPLIQELMRDDLNAVRSGKKSREQVGDSAVSLAREAQSPAEKYLLFTGAFDQYMRGGSYEKADSALTALRDAIPDWKSSDEFALIDKALRTVSVGKGGPVRERYEALKGRQQYAAKLKKAQALAQAKPTDKRLQFQVAAYQAALGDWPAALDAFIAGSNPACADAAKLEKESAPPAKIADAWWSAADVKPDFLSSAVRAHAVDLYKKALASNSLAGLQKVAAEKRIAEFEASLAASESPATSSKSSSSSSYVGAAKYYGVKIIGNDVKQNGNKLSGFSSSSYGLIDVEFSPGDSPIEAVVEISTPRTMAECSGILTGIGGNGFTPFFILKGSLMPFLSSSGKQWDIIAHTPIDVSFHPGETYRLKCEWDGNEYIWSVWRGRWTVVKRLPSKSPVFSGLKLQIGTNRGNQSPFNGEIDLSRCYIMVGKKLWWEGVKGAYKNANK